MKYAFVFVLLFVCFSGFGQPIPIDPATGKTTYSEVVEVANKKDALYKNAQTWITKTFGDYKAVIQFEDKPEGKLIIKGFTKQQIILLDRLNYTIAIDYKDNKYRVVISDIYQSSSDYPTDRFPIERLNGIIEKSENEVIQLNREIELAQKKTQLKELTQKRDLSAKSNREYSQSVQATSETIKGLLSSLKQAMSVKDDF